MRFRSGLFVTVVLGLILTLSTAGAWAATVIVDDEFEELNEDVWRVYRNSEGGRVLVEGGALRIENVDTGWKQWGVVLQEPIDLRDRVTTVRVEYLEAGHTEQNPGFWANPEIEGDDTWNYPGVRLTVYANGFNMTPTPPAGMNVMVFPDVWVDMVSWPATITWVLTWFPDEPNAFEVELFVDDELEAFADLLMDDPDPSEVYFYLYVSNDAAGPSPSVFNRVTITQEDL